MKDRAFLGNWGPVVGWAALIFYFSTESFSSPETSQAFGPIVTWLIPGLSADQLDTIHWLIRKLGHWSEYFIFAVLVRRALRHQFGAHSEGRHSRATAVIIFLYAVSDELHQAFVPNRTATFSDVLLDSFGGVCALT
jgi:VanZ family protein